MAALMPMPIPVRNTFIHFEDTRLDELPLHRHKTCPASLSLFQSSFGIDWTPVAQRRHTSCPASVPIFGSSLGNQSPSTPKSPVYLATLDFWACLCSTAIAAAVQPDLRSGEVYQTLKPKHSNSVTLASPSVAPGATSSTSWPASLKHESAVEGLDEVIESLNLQMHTAHINDWCRAMGAAYLAEVAEEAEGLCNAISLSLFERDRIFSWAAEVISSAVAPTPDEPTIAETVSQLTSKKVLVRTDGPSTKPKRTLWADLVELEVSDDVTMPAMPMVAARESRVRWANPLISVIEFCVDEHQEENCTAMQEPAETQQTSKQAVMRIDGLSTKPERTLWADLAELEVSELEDDSTLLAMPTVAARESRVRWANPLISVIEFCMDEDQEENCTEMEERAEIQQSQNDFGDRSSDVSVVAPVRSVTPKTPVDLNLIPLDFWACLCSTVIAAIMQPDLLGRETCRTPMSPKSQSSNPASAASPSASYNTSCPAQLKPSAKGLHDVITMSSLNLRRHATHIDDGFCTSGADYLTEVAESAEDGEDGEAMLAALISLRNSDEEPEEEEEEELCALSPSADQCH